MEITFRKRYTTSKSLAKGVSFGDKIDYVTGEKVSQKNLEKNNDAYILKKESKLKSKISDHTVAYYDKDCNPVHYSNIKERKRIKKEFDKASKNGNGVMHENVISFDKLFFEKEIEGKFNESQLANIVISSYKRLLVKENYNLKDIELVANFHYDTNNLHMHLDFVDKKCPNRRHTMDHVKELLLNDIICTQIREKYINLDQFKEKKKELQNEHLKGNIEPKHFEKFKFIRYMDKLNYEDNKKLRYYGDLDPENNSQKELIKIIDDRYNKHIKQDDYYKEMNDLLSITKATNLSEVEISNYEKNIKNQIFKEFKQEYWDYKKESKVLKEGIKTSDKIKGFKTNYKNSNKSYSSKGMLVLSNKLIANARRKEYITKQKNLNEFKYDFERYYE